MFRETHADYSLLQNGAVNLFWRKELFEKSLNELRKLGYALISIRFESMESFLVQLSEGLRWHDQFGYAPWTGNLDALNDSLRDPPSFSPSGCLAICIEDFDKLVSADREFAWKLLDILEYQSRDNLLFGRKLVALIQTNDNRYEAANIGARHAQWNRYEWQWSNRGIG